MIQEVVYTRQELGVLPLTSSGCMFCQSMPSSSPGVSVGGWTGYNTYESLIF